MRLKSNRDKTTFPGTNDPVRNTYYVRTAVHYYLYYTITIYYNTTNTIFTIPVRAPLYRYTLTKIITSVYLLIP